MARNPTTPRLPDPAASGAAATTTAAAPDAPSGGAGGAQSGSELPIESPAADAAAQQPEAEKAAAEQKASDEKAAEQKAADEKPAADKAPAEDAVDLASIAIDAMNDAQCDAALAALEGTEEAVAAQNTICREIRETINRQAEELKARLGVELRKLNQLIDVNLHAAERRRAIQARKEQLAQQVEQAKLALELAQKARDEAAEAKKSK